MTLTQDEVNQLKNYANELPTKYGATLLAFLIKKEQDVLHPMPQLEQAQQPVSEEK